MKRPRSELVISTLFDFKKIAKKVYLSAVIALFPQSVAEGSHPLSNRSVRTLLGNQFSSLGNEYIGFLVGAICPLLRKSIKKWLSSLR